MAKEVQDKSIGAILRESYSDGLFESEVGLGVFKTGFPLIDYGLGFPVDIYKGNDWVRREVHKGILMGSYMVIAGATATGKEQPYSSTIPTPDGIKQMGELKVGDTVFSQTGKPTQILDIFEQGVKDVYQVKFDDGRTVRCGLEHNWSYITKDGYGTKTLKEMMQDYKQKQYFIPLCEPVEYPHIDVPIDPMLLGCVLTWGRFYSPYVSIHTFGNDNIREVLKKAGYQLVRDDKFASNYVFYDNKMNKITWDEFFKPLTTFRHPSVRGEDGSEKPHYSAFLDYTKASTLHIPEIYLYNDIETRRKLLEGILIGEKQSRSKGIQYDTFSAALADDVHRLACSLGIYCKKVNTRSLDFRGRKYTTIVDIKLLPDQERSRCLLVDNEDHLYLTEKYVVTHNTTLAIQIASNIIRDYPNGMVYHFDLERADTTTRVMQLSQLPRCDFDVSNPNYRYILTQAPTDHETIQKVILRIYKEKMANPDKYQIKLDQHTEYGDPIVTMQPTVVLIDSIPMIGNVYQLGTSKDEKKMEESLTQMDAAQTAGAFKRMLKMVLGPMKQANIILIGITHIGTKIASNPMIHNKKDFRGLGQDELIAGGTMNTYGATNILKTDRRGGPGYTTENGDGFNGFDSMLTVVKSRTTFDAKQIPMVYDCENGFDSIRSIIQYAISRGIITGNRASMKFTADPDTKFSYVKLFDEIAKKPQIVENIMKYVITDLESGFKLEQPPTNNRNIFLQY